MQQDQQEQCLDPRVVVARDVIQQLNEKRLVARKGIYMRIPDFADSDDRWRPGRRYGDMFLAEIPREESVKKVLAGKTCEVCAIGALFVARVDQVNGVTVGAMNRDANNDRFMRHFLGTMFSRDQLSLIELAFEGKGFLDQYEDSRIGEGSVTWDMELGEITWEGGEHPDEDPPRYLTDAVKFTDHVHDAEERMRMIMKNVIVNDGEFCP